MSSRPNQSIVVNALANINGNTSPQAVNVGNGKFGVFYLDAIEDRVKYQLFTNDGFRIASPVNIGFNNNDGFKPEPVNFGKQILLPENIPNGVNFFFLSEFGTVNKVITHNNDSFFNGNNSLLYRGNSTLEVSGNKAIYAYTTNFNTTVYSNFLDSISVFAQQFKFIYAVTLNGDGAVATKEFKIPVDNPPEKYSQLNLEAIDEECFVLSWFSMGKVPVTDQGIYIKIFDSSFNAITNDILISQFINASEVIEIVKTNDGEFVVAWAKNHELYYQSFNADGSTNYPAKTVNIGTPGYIYNISLASQKDDGGFVINWIQSQQDIFEGGATYNNYFVEIDSEGLQTSAIRFLTGSSATNPYDTPSDTAISYLDNGGMSVSWMQNYLDDDLSIASNINLNIYDALGKFVHEKNSIIGSDEIDTLYGTNSKDFIYGGNETDLLYGRKGNDSYIVDVLFEGNIVFVEDVVIEKKGEGYDTIFFRSNLYPLDPTTSFVSLSNNVESGDLSGTGGSNLSIIGNSLSNYLIGNAGKNSLFGEKGADILEGRGGDDTYFIDNIKDVILEELDGGQDIQVISLDQPNSIIRMTDNVENAFALEASVGVRIYGNDLDNQVSTNLGNNYIDGGLGVDSMAGGLGNDTYVVDSFFDEILELANQGNDAVVSFVSYTMPENVEILSLFGKQNINASGNNLNNLILGNSGNNYIDGNGGNDTLKGGLGNDTYVLDLYFDTLQSKIIPSDVIIESKNGGIDQINLETIDNFSETSDLGYSLNSNIENLRLSDTFDFSIQLIGNGLNNIFTGNEFTNSFLGNSGNDSISGNGGQDYLSGGMGADTLIGGADADIYAYSKLSESLTGTKSDLIVGFNFNEGDILDFSNITDWNTKLSGKQSFTFIGTDNFTQAGQIRFSSNLLQADINGDRKADFEIRFEDSEFAEAAILI